MTSFYRKSEVVEATRWDGSPEVARAITSQSDGRVSWWAHNLLQVLTSRGVVNATVGAWVVRKASGEYCLYGHSAFTEAYEAIDDRG